MTKRINHKEHEEVTKDTKKAIIAPRGQDVAKTLQIFVNFVQSLRASCLKYFNLKE